jgi:hypothetical protein
MAESKPPEDEHQREQPERVEDKDPATDVSGVPAVQQEALHELARQIVKEAGLQAGAQQELREMREHEERVSRFSRNLEVLRSAWSLQFEIAKHTSAASGVLLLGLGALVGVFYPEPSLSSVAAVAAVLLVSSFIASIIEMTLVRNVILYDMARGFLSVEAVAGLPMEVAAQQAEHIPKDALEEAFKEVLEEELEKLPGLGLERNTSLWTVVHWATILTLGSGAVCFLVFALCNLIGGLWP